MLERLALVIIAVPMVGCAYLQIPSMGSYAYKAGKFPDAAKLPVAERHGAALKEYLDDADQILCDLRGGAPVIRQQKLAAIRSDLSMLWVDGPLEAPQTVDPRLFAPEMLSQLGVHCSAAGALLRINEGVLGPFDVLYTSRATLGTIVRWYFIGWSARTRHLFRLTATNRTGEPVVLQYTDLSRYIPDEDVVFFAKLATSVTNPSSDALIMRRDGRSGWHVMGPTGASPSDWGEEISAITVSGAPLAIPAPASQPTATPRPEARPEELPRVKARPATKTVEGIRFADGCVVREKPRSRSKKVGRAEAGVPYPLVEAKGRRWRRIRLQDGLEGWTSCRGEAAEATVAAVAAKPAEARFWYKSEGAKRSGPVSADALRRLFRAGGVAPQTWIWWEGQPKWIRLREAPQFADLQPSGDAAAKPEAAAPPAPTPPAQPGAAAAQEKCPRCDCPPPRPCPPPPQCPPPQPAKASPAPATPRVAAGRAWWVAAGGGGALRIRNNISQVKLLQSVGYHFRGGLSGPAIALEAQESFGSDSLLVEAGARLLWDIPIVPWLQLSPGVLFGFMHRSSETCVTLPAGGDTCYGLSSWGGALQLSLDVKLVLGRRVLVFVRPALDLMPSGSETTRDGATEDTVGGVGLRVDVAGGVGVLF